MVLNREASHYAVTTCQYLVFNWACQANKFELVGFRDRELPHTAPMAA